MSAMASLTRTFPEARAAFCSASAAARPGVLLRPLPLVPGVGLARELPLGELVAPVPEGPLRELHDVALVDDRDALPLVRDRVEDRGADEALGPFLRDGLEADGGRLGEADLLVHRGPARLQELEDLLRVLGPALELDPGVDVFRVLPEDDHVDLLGALHGGRDPLEPADRPEADVEVEELAQGDVQRADAAADRGREGPLDADEVLPEGLDRLVGKPRPEVVVGLLAREDLHPGDLPLAAVGLLDRGVQDAHGRAPDIRSRAVALDEGDDGIVGNDELSVDDVDLLAVRRGGHFRVGHHVPPGGGF
jgi:hypothetical protein